MTKIKKENKRNKMKMEIKHIFITICLKVADE